VATPGLKGADLKKTLPAPWQKQHAVALTILRELATKSQVFRYAKAKTERFFVADPFAALDRIVPQVLGREGSLETDALKKAVERDARGHGDLLGEWLKSALARRALFEHAPKVKKGKKRYSREPDLARLLGKTCVELKRVFALTDEAGVPRERVVEALRRELGLANLPSSASVPSPAPSPATDRELVRAALLQLAAEHPAGTLLLVHDLRARTPLDKDRFDAAALSLSREGAAVLHHHDHAAALSEEERRQLIADGRGIHYIGIAPRSAV
jgi:hypothetical protein